MNRSLRLTLVQHELVSMELVRPGHVCAVSGRHWLTVDGLDIDLAAGERVEIPAGTVLAEGNGMLEFCLGKVANSRSAPASVGMGKVCF